MEGLLFVPASSPSQRSLQWYPYWHTTVHPVMPAQHITTKLHEVRVGHATEVALYQHLDYDSYN